MTTIFMFGDQPAFPSRDGYYVSADDVPLLGDAYGSQASLAGALADRIVDDASGSDLEVDRDGIVAAIGAMRIPGADAGVPGTPFIPANNPALFGWAEPEDIDGVLPAYCITSRQLTA